MIIVETARLTLRTVAEDDAAFFLQLLNDPSFLRFIGDRGVRTLDDARQYIVKGPLASYERYGFGLWMVEETASGEAAGICGLVKREELDDVDVGFAFLPRFWSRGYATESAAAVVDYAWTVVHLPRLVAITNPDNVRSINVLEKVGLRFEKLVTFGAEGRELKLFACAAPRDA